MADSCALCDSSSNVRLCTGESTGRYLVVNRAFKAGEIVFRNIASSYLLSSEYWGQRCLRCFSPNAPGKELLQCGKCKKATYCSKNCQVGDWKLHKGECTHIHSIFGQNLPDSATNELLLLLRSLNLKLKQQHQCIRSADGAVLCGRDHSEGVYYNPLSSIDSADLVLASVAGRYCHEENPYLLRRLQQFHCNNFGIVDDLINCIGSAEYPATALLNHSCAPNCILRYNISSAQGPVVEVVAIKAIEIGEELCHSYTDCSSPTSLRQQRLRDIYRFSCQCKLCAVSMSSSSRSPVLQSSMLQDLIETPWDLRQFLARLRATTNIQHMLPVDHLLTEISM